MKIVERKKLALTGFIDELWTACAEGTEFKSSLSRRKHGLSCDYVTYIMANCVEKKSQFSYNVKKGQRRRDIVNLLATKSIRFMENANKTSLDVFAPLTKVTKKPGFKHLSAKDTLLSSTKFTGVVEDKTKKEVKATTKQVVEIDDLSKRSLPECTVTIKVTRTYPGGNDSTQFEVADSLDYNGLVSAVNKYKKV